MNSSNRGNIAKPSNKKRRCFHFFGILAAIMVALLLPERTFVIALYAATFSFILLEILRFSFPRLNQWLTCHLHVLLRDDEVRHPVTSTYILVASLVVVLLFGRDIAMESLLFLAVGDPAAAAVGQRWGRLRVRNKSLEGSLAFFLFSCAIGTILGSTILSLSLSVIVTGAILATLVELLSFRFDDNLTIPLASSGGMYTVKLMLTG